MSLHSSPFAAARGPLECRKPQGGEDSITQQIGKQSGSTEGGKFKQGCAWGVGDEGGELTKTKDV